MGASQHQVLWPEWARMVSTLVHEPQPDGGEGVRGRDWGEEDFHMVRKSRAGMIGSPLW